MRFRKSFPLASAILLSLAALAAARGTVDLAGEWRFHKSEAAADADVAGWENVTVPHSYNAKDGQDGGTYYRGPAWYSKSFEIPADAKGQRVFLQFEGAFLVTDVYLNGKHLGQHRGGFAGFDFEITDDLKSGANELRVRVDNAANEDVPPLSADFTMEGGIYRPVHLLVTNDACISPLDHGSPGVFISQEIAGDAAKLSVRAELDALHDTAAKLEVKVTDAAGKVVASESKDVELAAGKRISATIPLEMKNPHLWNGRKDPYLYQMTVSLMKEDAALDSVTQPLGLRTFGIDQEKGFLLNGEPYAMHGVNRHQEKRDMGWALADADHKADIDMILEIGATCLRLAHYQQSRTVLDLCDRSGLIVWEEIPLVNAITPSDAFADNAENQLTELIRQHFNHPSVAAWSMFNELYLRPTPPVESLVKRLKAKAHELDPGRAAVGAACVAKQAQLSNLPDWIGFNLYPGWYGGKREQMAKWISDRAATVGDKRIAITEYGGGGNPNQHEEGEVKMPNQKGQWHPEEYQALIHEAQWKGARDHPKVWGTYVWAMFDFASDTRDEGGNPGVNDKGLVTEDRKLKKDAFYFYKANWNPEPMVYLTSRRMTPRKQAETEVKAYSNCSEVELAVNGKSLGKAKPDDLHICRWEKVKLKPGKNAISLTATADGKELSDKCEWVLENP